MLLTSPACFHSSSSLSIRRLSCIRHNNCKHYYSQLQRFNLFSNKSTKSPSHFVPEFCAFSTSTTETTTTSSEVEPIQIKEISDDEVPLEDLSDAEEKPVSPILASLHLYKDALTSNDESKISELEDFFQSIEDDKNSLSAKVATLFEELAVDSDHILRINFAFASFRATTEREQLSLVTNVKGEMVECLLSVLDSFERAKFEIKVETEGEEKINNSYQSIYKQFVEILALLGVVPPETVESTFDSLGQFKVVSKLSQLRHQIFRVLNGIRSNFVKT